MFHPELLTPSAIKPYRPTFIVQRDRGVVSENNHLPIEDSARKKRGLI